MPDLATLLDQIRRNEITVIDFSESLIQDAPESDPRFCTELELEQIADALDANESVTEVYWGDCPVSLRLRSRIVGIDYSAKPLTVKKWQVNPSDPGMGYSSHTVLPDGRFMTCGSDVRLWDPTEATLLKDWKLASSRYVNISYLGGKFVLAEPSSGRDGPCFLINIETYAHYVLEGAHTPMGQHATLNDRYIVMKINDHGTGAFRYIKAWDLQTGKALCDRFSTGDVQVQYLAGLSDGYFITADPQHANDVKVWRFDASKKPPFDLVKKVPGYMRGWKSPGDHVRSRTAIDLPKLKPGKHCFAWATGQSPCSLIVADLDPKNKSLVVLEHENHASGFHLAGFDEKKVVTWSGQDGKGYWINIWDLMTQQPIVKLEGHRQGIRTVVGLSKRYLASIATDGLKVWDIQKPGAIHSFDQPYNHISQGDLSVLPDGQLLCCNRSYGAGTSGQIFLYNFPRIRKELIEKPKPQYTILAYGEKPTGSRGWSVVPGRQDCGVPDVLVLDDGRFVTTGVDLRMWDANASDPTTPVKIWEAPIANLGRIKRLGKHFFVAEVNGSDRLNYIIDIEALAHKTLAGFTCRLNSAVVVLDKYLIASNQTGGGSSGNQLKIWDMESGEVVCQGFPSGFGYPIECLKGLSGNYLIGSASPTVDGIGIRIWKVDLAKNPPFALVKNIPGNLNSGSYGEHVIDLPYLIPDKHCFAWSSKKSPCHLMVSDLDAKNQNPLFSLGSKHQAVTGIRRLDRVRVVAWGSYHGGDQHHISIWNLETRKAELELKVGHGDPQRIHNVIQLSENFIASTARDAVKVWNIKSANVVQTFVVPGIPHQTSRIALLPDGRQLCVYSYTGPSGTIFIHDFPRVQANPALVQPHPPGFPDTTPPPSKSRVQIRGLKYQPVPDDGHCFYHAVALYLGHDQAFLRDTVATHLEDDLDQFRAFLELAEGQTAESYLVNVRAGGNEWAGNVEIEVLMLALNRPIIIIHGTGQIRNLEVIERFPGQEPIFVYYNGHTHYDAMILDGTLPSQAILQALLSQQTPFIVEPPGPATLLQAAGAQIPEPPTPEGATSGSWSQLSSLTSPGGTAPDEIPTLRPVTPAQGAAVAPPPSPLQDWHIPQADVTDRAFIAHGGFGEVYRANWAGHCVVALKVLFAANLAVDDMREFEREAALLVRLRHPHIVSFYGVCVDTPPPGMVLEYMTNGDLYKVLHDHVRYPGGALTWSIRCRIATESSKGIAFLHREKIMHRDVKSHNILLDDGMHAKVSDFGLSRTRDITMATSTMPASQVGAVGTAHYLSPELWEGHGASKAVDVYALGIVFFELMTRERPYHDRGFVNTYALMAAVIGGARPTIPDGCSVRVTALTRNCWLADPAARPRIEDVVEALEREYEELTRQDAYGAGATP